MAFDDRFDPDEEYWQGPGTRSATEWLRDLRSYQAVCGFGEVPPKTHEPFGPLSQWVQRMRRYADSGKLPFEIAAELAVMGVPLELDRAKQKTAATQEDNSFERNLAQLQDWIRAEVTPVANLAAISPFFTQTAYVGAVRNAQDTWYAGWTCGLPGGTAC